MAGEYYSDIEQLMFMFGGQEPNAERDRSLRNSIAYKIYRTQSIEGVSRSDLRSMLDSWDHYNSSRKGFKFERLHARMWEEPLSRPLEREIVHEVSRWFDLTRWKINKDPLTDPEYEGLFI